MPDQIQSTTISKSAVDRAGEVLRAASVDQTKRDDALRIMSSWRSRHVYVINTFQATLRKRLGGFDSYGLVAQRLKRSTSIIAKLQRLNNMKLSRMQDIGGIRAVVDRLGQIDQLRGLYEVVGRLDHKLLAIDDYITNPKKDGYRSVHLIFRYHSPELPHCNGLLLELQFRTKLQHAWATAVETMGTFLGQSLKARQGESHWQQFFELTSAAISHVEKSPVLSNWSGLDFESTCVAIRDAELQIGVLDKLQGFSLVVDAVSAESRRSSNIIWLFLTRSRNRSQSSLIQRLSFRVRTKRMKPRKAGRYMASRLRSIWYQREHLMFSERRILTFSWILMRSCEQ